MYLFGIPACIALLISIVLVRRRNRLSWAAACSAAVLLVVAFLHEGLFPFQSPGMSGVTRADVQPRVPEQDFSGGFTGAASCQECHPYEHSSWHQTFHRSMTQAVSPETVAAPIGDVVLKSRGREFHLWRDGDTFWAEMVDPEWDLEHKRRGATAAPADGPRVQRQIVMSTGSHHFQTFWINGTKGNQLWQVPFVYHFGHKQWIPVEDSIINPPSDYRRLADWNDACIKCHAVRGKPGLDQEQVYESRVVNLGIACESCHGPGRAHIEFQRQVAGGGHVDGASDPIINPVNLKHDRASHVCAQCHSLFHYDHQKYLRSEFAFRPGDDLQETRSLYHFEDKETQSQTWLQDAYWRDGSVRVAIRMRR